jgi:hypothetical protein
LLVFAWEQHSEENNIVSPSSRFPELSNCSQ